MICYLFYTGVDWSGIRTAFITCCIIALETSGASMHKGTLRIVGCLGGGVLGFLCSMYLIPHMTGITSLLVLSAFGASIGAWIATGSERIGYAGVQINYAFFICIDQHYGPEVDFSSIRDRIVGILLGLTVSSVIYRYLWPEQATDKLRVVFARALRNTGRLVKLSPSDANAKPPRELYESVITDLAETQQLLASARFEDQDDHAAAALASAQPQAMVRHAQALCLVAGQLLLRPQEDEWQALGAGERAEDERARDAAAETLARTARFVGHGERVPEPRAEDDHGQPPEEGDRARLRRRLMEQCRLLTQNCRAVGSR